MATIPLTNESRRRLVQILVERADLHTPLSRQNFLDDAGISDLAGKLHFDTNAEGFAKQLVRVLQNQGTSPGTNSPALVSLLHELKQVVAGHQDEVTFIESILVQALSSSKRSLLRNGQQALLDLMLDPMIPPSERLVAGQNLAEVGDPRPGVGLGANDIPDILWVQVTEGKCQIGGDEVAYKSLPLQEIELPTFWIAKYPLTNSQWEVFMRDGGYEGRQWWKGLQRPEPSPSPWPHANFPRTNIGWYEAVAYCRWLSNQLGYEVRLPTGEEWEKAARGLEGRLYPWGNRYVSGYANIDERYPGYEVGPHYLKQTSPAGMYINGASPYGVLDMVGNIREWTLSTRKQLRALRGGGWAYHHQHARAASQSHRAQDARSQSWGIRLVRTTPD